MSFWVSLHAEHGYLFAEEMWVPRIYLFCRSPWVAGRLVETLVPNKGLNPGLCSEVKY